MQLTIGDLRAGMAAFRARWPTEAGVHADLYDRHRRLLAHGVTAAAWPVLVDDLFGWSACRPLSKRAILDAGFATLAQLDVHRSSLTARTSPRPLTMADVDWCEVSDLFTVAQAIKPTRANSAVFPSKLCHFLLPAVFPLCDGEFAANSGVRYAETWTDARTAWLECADQESLIAELATAVDSHYAVGYPWCTKIADLCAAGRLRR